MRIYLLLFFVLLAVATGYTQQLHFAYLQTDTHTPFYVTLNKKNYSSTASGYLILPKLQNGDYGMRIGFAKNEEGEQEFLLQVKDNDQGFLIKDFGDKGWGLFNLQTMAVQYAGTAAREKAKLAAAEKAEAEQRQRKTAEEMQAVALQRRNDSIQQAVAAQKLYTDSVTAVVAANRQRMYNDSVANQQKFLLQQRATDSVANLRAVAKENERLEQVADSLAKAQAVAIKKQTEKPVEIVKDEKPNETTTPPASSLPQKKESVKNSPAPVLIQQAFTDSGWHYAYHITNDTQRETVLVFIPSAQPKLQVITRPVFDERETAPANPVSVDSVKLPNSHTGQDTTPASIRNTAETAPVEKPIMAGSTTPVSVEAKDTAPTIAEKVAANPNCREVANDKDFLNARKKIAAAFGTDAMLVAAQKVLKQKCYTTEQLRNLCVLFLTDVSRYQFLDMAYAAASDAYRYASLQDLLLDAYFIQRFKAMLR